MNSHKNAPLTPKGREGHGAVCGSGTEQSRRRTPVQHHTEDGRQMGRTVPRRRCRWFARPLLQASFIAKPNGACHMRGR
jgi:hypothetical protein